MTVPWWASTVLALALCFAVGGVATLVDVLRHRYGNRRADAMGSLFMLLALGYVAVGIGIAAYMAISRVVPSTQIEYDSQEFLR